MSEVKQRLRKEALRFLQKHHACAVATISSRNKPEVSAVEFLIDNRFHLYFVTRRHSRKYKNLLGKRSIALVVGTAEKPTVVQIEGIGTILSKREMGEFLNFLSKRKAAQKYFFGSFLKFKGIDFAVVKMIPEWLRLTHFHPKTKTEEYHVLIP